MPAKTKKRRVQGKKTKKGRQFDYYRPGRLAYEGKSARKELKRIVKYGKKLDEMLHNHDDLPEWVQKKNNSRRKLFRFCLSLYGLQNSGA